MNNKTEYEIDLMKEAFEPMRKRIDIQVGGWFSMGVVFIALQRCWISIQLLAWKSKQVVVLRYELMS
jgi:hypothetical protein